jgi:DNA-directed RNA polymerase subunit F
MDTLSKQIADFIVGAKFADLPPEVIRKAKEEIVG